MYKTLSNGVLMPKFGLGTFLVADGKTAYDTVSEALKIGYRHIDTAQAYQNEASIGDAIKDSGIPRDQLFITTKQRMHAEPKMMEEAFLSSLKKLKTDYIDLYLIHWPNHKTEINQQSWAFFESMYQQNKIRAIGVSNFQIHHLNALKDTIHIKPMVNQVECHLGLQQIPLRSYLEKEGIAIESYGPFMKGGIFESPFKEVLEEVASKYQKSIPQIVIAWGLHNDIIMIPKSSTKERLKENFEATKIVLEPSDLEKLNQLNRGKRVYTDPDNSPWGYHYEASS